jgi:hypothetical protein
MLPLLMPPSSPQVIMRKVRRPVVSPPPPPPPPPQKAAYTLAETDMMSDYIFAREFIRLTNCGNIRCCHCRIAIGDDPMVYIKTMRKRVHYTKGSTLNPLGGLTPMTKPVKSCDEKSKYNNRANPGINPLYQAKRRARDAKQIEYIDHGISHTVKTAYWGC